MARRLLRVAAFVTLLAIATSSLHVSQWLASTKHKDIRKVQDVFEQRGQQAEAANKR